MEEKLLSNPEMFPLKLENVVEFLNKESPINLLCFKLYNLFMRLEISSDYLKKDPTQ